MKHKTRKYPSKIRDSGKEYELGFLTNYPILFEKNKNTCWTVTCPILPGCISEGNTKEEAIENIKDAIRLYLRSLKKEIQTKKRQGAEIFKIKIGA